MSFWCELAVNVLGGLISGALVAVIVLLGLERVLHVREERAARTERVQAILRLVETELSYDSDQVDLAIKTYDPSGDIGDALFPLFMADAWALITQVSALTEMPGDLLDLLLPAYNRIRSANEMHAELRAVAVGSTAAAFAIAHNAAVRHELADRNRQAHEQALVALRRDMVDRLVDTRAHLRPALDAVRAYLATQGTPRGTELSEPGVIQGKTG